MLPTRDWAVELPRMIDRQEPESLYLDYKASESMAPRTQRGRQRRADDVSKDVSSFLNSAGGALIYGIREDRDPMQTGGSPLPVFDSTIDGFAAGEVTKEEVENVITGNINNRPGPDLFTVVEVPMGDGRHVIVVDISQSMVGAFQAKDSKYYRRWNFKAEPMEHYEIEDVRVRATGPQLRMVVGLNDMWHTRTTEAVQRTGEQIVFRLHFGILNEGIRVADTALIEFGLERATRVEARPSRPVPYAGTRIVRWTTPESGDNEDTMNWYHFRWTPQVLEDDYHSLFATEDPAYAFQMQLSAPPGRPGTIIPVRLQAPGMSSNTALVAIDLSDGGTAVRKLDWPHEIRPVLQR